MKKLLILCLGFIPFAMILTGSQEFILADNYSRSDRENKQLSGVLEDEIISFNSKAEDDLSLSLLEFEDYISKNLLSVKEELLSADPNLYDGMHTFTKDSKTVFFSVNRKIKKNKEINDNGDKTKSSVNLHLFKAIVNEKGEWVNLEMLPFNNENFSTGQPTLNNDDTKLYFVSDGPGSLGRTDIFSVELNGDGTYGQPENLGPKINSIEREIFPFIDADNVLFYSSDVLNEKGDLDVFAAKVYETTISKPILLSVSVFTEKDDLSSIKKAGKGADEIYGFASSQPLFFDCKQKISGKVKNSDTMESLSKVRLDLIDENNKKLLSLQSDDADGTFSFDQSCHTNYILRGYLDGYLAGEIRISTANDLGAEAKEIVLALKEDRYVEKQKVTEAPTSLPIAEDSSVLFYDFNSQEKVYSVQIGAFKGNAKTEQFNNITGVFNHVFKDGFNRYFSGVYKDYSEALDYKKVMNKQGYYDAFIVSLQGENRIAISAEERDSK